MLFAQGAMAWSACDWLVSSPVRAVQTAADAAPCHESPNVAVCLTHCLSDRQAVQKVVFELPAMPSAPVLKLVLPAVAVSDTGVSSPASTAAATGPPRRILLQSFQI